MAYPETVNIIQPRFSKLEECLDLKPILGKMFSKEIFNLYRMQELQSLKDNRIEQNRAFLMYLLNQPVEQVKKFCCILQEDIGNASHQELATEMLTAIPPADPWKHIPHLLQMVANQFSKSPDTRALLTLLKQDIPSDVVEVHRSAKNPILLLSHLLEFHQTNCPKYPRLFLAYLLFVVEETARKGVTDVTPVRKEILRAYQSLD